MEAKTESRSSPIEDYALIGDCLTGALVGRDGSIDWLCWPRFDSDACLSALLGTPEHGHWRIAPADPVRRVERGYRGDTLILETVFETSDGSVALIDAMPVGRGCSSVIRRVEGRSGRVAMRMDLALRFDFGSSVPWVTQLDDGSGVQAVSGPNLVTLRAGVPLRGEGKRTVAEFTVEAGESYNFVLAWGESHLSPPAAFDVVVELERTREFWQAWADCCAYEGRWKRQVLRSLLTLKALTYAPTGGIVAALTTSLPEQLGGARNWDYRYCWLRDATLTLAALLKAGYQEEAQAWRNWLHRAVAGDPARMQIMYGIGGERRLVEWTAEWLPGYGGAAPVRVGNAAAGQRQLDIFGEIACAGSVGRASGLTDPGSAWPMQVLLVEYLEGIWEQPDEGIWETRGDRRHFTYSKVMAWAALNASIADAERHGFAAPLDRWRTLRARMHAEICAKAFDPVRDAFTQSYGYPELDATALLLPLVGFLPATDPRMVGTVAAVERELSVNGLLLRYRTDGGADGLPPGEGTFLPCSFWLARVYALQGRQEEALTLFERLLGLANDVGLLSEEYDADAKRQVGNVPQAFSHLALIDTALNLDARLSAQTTQSVSDPGR